MYIDISFIFTLNIFISRFLLFYVLLLALIARSPGQSIVDGCEKKSQFGRLARSAFILQNISSAGRAS